MAVVQTYAPDPILAQDVQCFWTYEQSDANGQRGPILPDAHVELIFNCGGSHILETAYGELIEMPPVALNGLQRGPFHSRIKGECQFIAVRLNAWAMRHFVDLPDDFCERPAVALGGIWKEFAPTVAAAMRSRGSMEAIACLQQLILDIRRPDPVIAPIRGAGELLNATYGNVGLNELADRSSLSPRQFERQFKYSTGVSPKMYARLIRHETARITLSRNPQMNMVALAQELGYSDQAHFIHDFKAFTSFTPGQYAAHITVPAQQAEASYGFSQ